MRIHSFKTMQSRITEWASEFVHMLTGLVSLHSAQPSLHPIRIVNRRQNRHPQRW